MGNIVIVPPGSTGRRWLPVDLQDCAVIFLDELEAAGRAAGTVHNYSVALRLFSHHLNGCHLTQALPLDVRDFLDTQRSQNTRYLRLILLRAFYRFLLRRGLVTEDPTKGVPLPRTHSRLWNPLGEQEFERVLQVSDEYCKVFLLILWRLGARLGETCRIRAEHVRLEGDGGTIDFPKRKGGGHGFAAFWAADLAEALSAWLPSHPGWLFPREDGPVKEYRMKWLILRAGKLAGLSTRLTAHRIRHAYITKAVEAGWPQLALQQQVGHRSPASTAPYYHPSRKGLLDLSRKLAGA